MFKIEVTLGPTVIGGDRAYWAEITLNNEIRRFPVIVSYWSLEDFKRQWNEGL